MKLLLISIGALCCLLPAALSEVVRLLDLEPADAQQIIDGQDQTLHYAPKIESNVPAVRVLGNEPHHVLEDVYLARQYHGQDGLGGYLYGYSVPDISKTEKKQAGGDLRGAYNYIAGDGQEIKVQYWDDGTGFHQVDNVPKILPKQIEDSPDVKEAKEKFLARWNEEAERNQHPIQDPYAKISSQNQGQFKPQGSTQYPHTSGGQSANQFQQAQPTGQYHQNSPSQSGGQYGQQGGQYQQPSAGGFGHGQQPIGGQYQGNQGQYHGGSEQGASGQPGQGGFGQGSTQGQSGHIGGQYQGQSGLGQGSAQGQPGPTGGQFQGQGGFGQGSAQEQTGHTGGQYQGQGGQGSSQGGQYQGFGQDSAQEQPGHTGGQYQGQSGFGQGSVQGQPGHSEGQYQGQGSAQGQPGHTGGQYQGQGGQSGGQGGFGSSGQGGASAHGQSGGFAHGQPGGQYQLGQQGASSNQNQVDYSGQYSENKDVYAQQKHADSSADEGTTGPPKGFFYSFDYPVGIIVSKDGRSVKREGDLKDIYSANKAQFEAQVQSGSGVSNSYHIN